MYLEFQSRKGTRRREECNNLTDFVSFYFTPLSQLSFFATVYATLKNMQIEEKSENP